MNGLNALAYQDLLNTITRRINGSLNGLDDWPQLWGEGTAMHLFDLIPAQFRVIVVALLMVMMAAGSAVLAWTAQGWL